MTGVAPLFYSLSASKAAQNKSLSSKINPLPSGDHLMSLHANRLSPAGTLTHSANSPLSPPSFTSRSSFHIYIAPVPVHRAIVVPVNVGALLTRACSTGWLHWITLRSRGLHGSSAPGKLYMKARFGKRLQILGMKSCLPRLTLAL